MEIGSLLHLQGEYHESNQLLESAERFTETEPDIRSSVTRALIGKEITPYTATDFEKMFINYYKLTNYLSLAQLSPYQQERDTLLDGARVEARRIDIKLNELAIQHGTHKEAAERKRSALGQLSSFLKVITGTRIDKQDLIYRDDPWSHYLAGYTYEQLDELDSARLEYEKAAVLYESGAKAQYQLQGNITEQAWFDTIRVMKKAGGYEDRWQQLSETKLSAELRGHLETSAENGQLLVVEQVGLAPQKKTLQVVLTAHSYTRSLVLAPMLTGTLQNQRDQQAWFYLLYADKASLVGLANLHSAGIINGTIYSLTRKTIPLGGAWDSAMELGIPQALQFGARVSVPYYSLLRSSPGPSVLSVGTETVQLSDSTSVAQLAIQEQLQQANWEIYEGLTREIIKAITTDKLGGIPGLGSLTSWLTASSDSRSWLTLPQQIRMTRVFLTPGKHIAKLSSQVRHGQPAKLSSKQFTIKKGQNILWLNNSLASTNATAL